MAEAVTRKARIKPVNFMTGKAMGCRKIHHGSEGYSYEGKEKKLTDRRLQRDACQATLSMIVDAHDGVV